MADSWLFSKPWSGFGGSGGGVFSCLTSEVPWQEEKKKKHERFNPLTTGVTIFWMWHVICPCILYSGDPDSVCRCPWLSLAPACQSLVSETEAGYGWLFSYRASLCTWCHMTNSQWVKGLPEKRKIKLCKWLLLWRDGTANQIFQVVTTTSWKRIYSTLKLPSYLWDFFYFMWK